MSGDARNDGALILGHPRSGTTLLRRLLNAHPEIAAPPETLLFGGAARFLSDMTTPDGNDLGVLSALSFLGFDESEVKDGLLEYCMGFLERYAREQSKPRWVEKTAFDAFEIPEIAQLCREKVYYIGVVRHPLSVAVSTVEFCNNIGAYPPVLHKFIGQYPEPIEAFVRSWIKVMEDLVDLCQRFPDRSLIIRYEDLVEEPEETIGSVLEFIHADSDTAFLSTALDHIGTLGYSDHKSYHVNRIHSTSIERWRDLPAFQIARMGEILSPWLEEFGYEQLPSYGGDKETARRRYLHSLGISASARSERSK